MTLHIFNPEHDIALASGLENFTAPHAGRQLHHDLGFLPAFWAKAGDTVMVDDAEQAETALKPLAVAARRVLRIVVNGTDKMEFVTASDVKAVTNSAFDDQRTFDDVEPWGWDPALRSRLRRLGIADSLLPDDGQLQQVRQLSHRRTSARLLGMLLADSTLRPHFPTGEGWGIIGEVPAECATIDEVETALARYGRAVLKAPWSSSGRGLRFIGTGVSLQSDKVLHGWLRGLLSRQGSVMAEPYYNKVKDFGMEFEAGADGRVAYCGLSLFHTANGAYTGNIVATEQAKREMISRYLPLELLDAVKERICQHLTAVLQGRYRGPLGVDMMVCANPASPDNGFLLHPCVEINLRRTMGHVALALTPADDDLMGVMRINYSSGIYRMTLTSLQRHL